MRRRSHEVPIVRIGREPPRRRTPRIVRVLVEAVLTSGLRHHAFRSRVEYDLRFLREAGIPESVAFDQRMARR